MSKGGSNILANCFKKTTKNTKDYVPSTAKQENIREGIPLKFPDHTDTVYTADILPNTLFEEWPPDEEVNSFDFSNKGEKFTDPNSNLIIFPYSLRKETYASMAWMRPDEYMKQKNLITAIKEKYENRNYNYIKNKFDLARKNLLNFEYTINPAEKEENSDVNNNENIEDNNNTKEENKQESNIFSKMENMQISIKRRNSIDIANAEGENSNLGREFYSSKLNQEEKKILLDNDNKINDFYIVQFEEGENNIEPQPVKQASQKNKNAEIQIAYNKLKPSNLNLGICLCDYCRWVSSQYQLLLDNNLYTENNKNHFLRKIYPQDKNGVPIYNPSGLYWVKLYHMGKFRKIVIDEKLPVNKETYETFLPQCESPFELWPMILTKAIIKLYSYKYKCDSYEQDEVGDCSILYSLTRHVGVKLSSFKFIQYLIDIQDIKTKQLLKKNEEEEEENNNNNEENENKENKENKENEKVEEDINIDIITLNNKNNKELGYDAIIGYIKSRDYLEEKENHRNYNNIGIINKSSFLLENDIQEDKEKFPIIDMKKNRNSIVYSDKTYKIKDLSFNMRNRRGIKTLKKNINVPPEYQLLYDKLNKHTGLSTRKELDPYKKFEKYFEEHRFLTNENIYKNYQKYITKKTNKTHKNGLICDVGYTLLEIFQCGNFNMKRLKPIYFGDMKLNIKVKYKQMSQEEKILYLDKIKELRKQKIELISI